MPRPRKLALNNTVLFVTTSVEEGFMFPPNDLIRLLVLNCLAKAQMHNPVDVCHFLLESTHLHMILYVTNPDDVKGFMERFKTESAHAINRILGRTKRTIWCAGYDSPVVLNLETAIGKIVYIYENPSKDGLVDSVDIYPGISSWGYFRRGSTEYKTWLIPRDEIRALPEGPISPQIYKNKARILSKNRKSCTFEINPNAWMKAFGVTDTASQKEINDLIVTRVAEKEKLYREERRSENRHTIGVNRLMATRPGTPYTPIRVGRRMLCHCNDREIRMRFISFAKRLIALAIDAFGRWRQGDIVPFPLGLYPPSLPKLGEPLGAW